MKLPFQAKPVLRQTFHQIVQIDYSGVTPSAKQDITGMARCMKGNSVLFTSSSTICAKPTHGNCTAAKAQAVIDITTACKNQGGIPSQSGNPCSYGAKC